MDQRSINRINELTQISRQRPLTETEQIERKRLRENYLQAFRGQLRQQLEHTIVEYPDGSRAALKEVARREK